MMGRWEELAERDSPVLNPRGATDEEILLDVCDLRARARYDDVTGSSAISGRPDPGTHPEGRRTHQA